MTTTDKELTGLLDKLEVSHKGSVNTREQAASAEGAWVAKFEEVRRTVIRPALEALGEQIRKREHDFNIVETQFTRVNRAIPIEASIRMDLYLSTERTRTVIGADRRPFLGFTTHHRSETVQVTLCDITAKGGVVSKIGDYPLDKVDKELIREKFIALFNRLLKQHGTTP
jgi:hypothetical protein